LRSTSGDDFCLTGHFADDNHILNEWISRSSASLPLIATAPDRLGKRDAVLDAPAFCGRAGVTDDKLLKMYSEIEPELQAGAYLPYRRVLAEPSEK